MKKFNMLIRKELIRELGKGYNYKSKSDKSKIIDNVVETTGLNRNYACRSLRTSSDQKDKKNKKKVETRGRKSLYKDAFEALKFIWHIMGFPCGKNLKASIKDVIENLELHGQRAFDQDEFCDN